MLAEFIYRPISGQFLEVHFGNVTPYSAWVLFTDKSYKQWTGSFARGWEGFATLIINVEEHERAFIVAGGNGYLINLTKKQLVNNMELSDIKTAIADVKRKRIIFSNSFNIQYIDFDGKISTLFNEHYFDEIELLEIRGDELFA